MDFQATLVCWHAQDIVSVQHFGRQKCECGRLRSEPTPLLCELKLTHHTSVFAPLIPGARSALAPGRLGHSSLVGNGFESAFANSFVEVPEDSHRHGGQSSLQTKGAGLFYCSQHLFIQHGKRGVRRQVKTIKTRVSPETMKTVYHGIKQILRDRKKKYLKI